MNTNTNLIQATPANRGTAPTILNPETDALIVVDVQNDFCPGGALAVPDGDSIVAGVAALAQRFRTVVLTQDAHPAQHASFASTHGLKPYAFLDFPYGPQQLWPDHCVQGTPGAQFHPGMAPVADRASLVIRKGMNPQVDSYSAFFENDKATTTGFSGYLEAKGIKRLFVVGLALDFCVGYTALDGRTLGFEVVVVRDLTRAIGIPLDNGQTTTDDMDRKFTAAGVHVVQASDIGPAATPRSPSSVPRR